MSSADLLLRREPRGGATPRVDAYAGVVILAMLSQTPELCPHEKGKVSSCDSKEPITASLIRCSVIGSPSRHAYIEVHSFGPKRATRTIFCGSIISDTRIPRTKTFFGPVSIVGMLCERRNEGVSYAAQQGWGNEDRGTFPLYIVFLYLTVTAPIPTFLFQCGFIT